MLTGMLKLGSFVPSFSHSILRLMLAGPSNSSLSSFAVSFSIAFPLLVSSLTWDSVASSKLSFMSSPTLPKSGPCIRSFHFCYGLPDILSRPRSDPTSRSSGTKNISVEPPPVKKHLLSSSARAGEATSITTTMRRHSPIFTILIWPLPFTNRATTHHISLCNHFQLHPMVTRL